jgi:hypothetical protein
MIGRRFALSHRTRYRSSSGYALIALLLLSCDDEI